MDTLIWIYHLYLVVFLQIERFFFSLLFWKSSGLIYKYIFFQLFRNNQGPKDLFSSCIIAILGTHAKLKLTK